MKQGWVSIRNDTAYNIDIAWRVVISTITHLKSEVRLPRFLLYSLGIVIDYVFQTNNKILLNELSLIWIHSRKANRLYDCDSQIANYILEFQQLRFQIKGMLSNVVLGWNDGLLRHSSEKIVEVVLSKKRKEILEHIKVSHKDNLNFLRTNVV